MIAKTMTWLMVALVGPVAHAQLGRVEDGRANDASLRVGSGGVNRRANRNVGPYGNQIVEGNVGRGKEFRGFSTISSPTAFGLGTTDFQGVQLGTTTLDGFRRDSVGVDAYRRNYQPQQPVPYYSRTNTVISAGGHAVDFQPTGVRRGSRSYIHLPKDRWQVTPDDQKPFSRQIRIKRYSNLPGLRPSDTGDAAQTGYTEPVRRSALFGIAPDPAEEARETRPTRPGVIPSSRTRNLRTPDEDRTRAGLAREQQQDDASDQPLVPPSGVVPAGSAMERLLGKEPASSTKLDGTGARTLGDRPADEKDKPRPLSAQRRIGEPTPEQQARAAERSSVSYRPSDVRPEGDLFGLMRRAASLSKPRTPEADKAGKDEPPAPGARAEQPERDAQQPDAAKPADAAAPQQEPIGAAALDERVRQLLERPIQTFEGTAKTLADRAFAKAEKDLAAGRYYDAVAAYDAARAADPGNPLVWIGRGHALIGAGDYLAAVQSLEQGLRRFPDLAKFKLDLKAFLGHGDILMIRRADLEERLEKNENYRLRFLLGYLEYYSGLEKFGLANLQKAAKKAPETSPIATFPAKIQGK